MKHVTILLIIGMAVLSGYSNAQEIRVNNFVINQETNDYKWQHIFSCDNGIFDYFTMNPKFSISSSSDNAIIGKTLKTIIPKNYDYEKRTELGWYSMCNYPSEVVFKVELKDSRYRVTVIDVIWTPDINMSMFGASTNANMQFTLKDMLFKNRGKLKANYEYNTSVLNSYFMDIFTVSEVETDDDW